MRGTDLHDAVVEAGKRRFRPILLTSLTTFFGLMPMILETSVQAQFLIPMAVSLGFGIVVSGFMVLFVTPAIAVVIEDLRRMAGTAERVIEPEVAAAIPD
jgi:multidrug efflux pump subunit AcrB